MRIIRALGVRTSSDEVASGDCFESFSAELAEASAPASLGPDGWAVARSQPESCAELGGTYTPLSPTSSDFL